MTAPTLRHRAAAETKCPHCGAEPMHPCRDPRGFARVLHVARIEQRRTDEAVAEADRRARALLEHACPSCRAVKGNSCFNRFKGRKLGTKICEARLALVGVE